MQDKDRGLSYAEWLKSTTEAKQTLPVRGVHKVGGVPVFKLGSTVRRAQKDLTGQRHLFDMGKDPK